MSLWVMNQLQVKMKNDCSKKWCCNLCQPPLNRCAFSNRVLSTLLFVNPMSFWKVMASCMNSLTERCRKAKFAHLNYIWYISHNATYHPKNEMLISWRFDWHISIKNRLRIQRVRPHVRLYFWVGSLIVMDHHMMKYAVLQVENCCYLCKLPFLRGSFSG